MVGMAVAGIGGEGDSEIGIMFPITKFGKAIIRSLAFPRDILCQMR